MSDIYLIRPVTSEEECILIESMARVILHEVYDAYIPPDHTDYFLNRYQSAHNIQREINKGGEYYLITHSGAAIGYIGLEINPPVMTLSKLYLSKEYRGQSIGKQAMDLVEERARQLGVSETDLIVNRKNIRAIAFYERHGFHRSADLEYASPLGYTIYAYKMTKTYPV